MTDLERLMADAENPAYGRVGRAARSMFVARAWLLGTQSAREAIVTTTVDVSSPSAPA